MSANTQDRIAELLAEGPILFYDGECGFCDKTVKFLIRHDKHRRLRFAPLQGSTASELLPALEGDREQWAVKFLDSDGLHERSTAVLRAAALTGGIWSLAKPLLVIPKFIRDGVYRFIARYRYLWAGKFDSCAVPPPELRERFLP